MNIRVNLLKQKWPNDHLSCALLTLKSKAAKGRFAAVVLQWIFGTSALTQFLQCLGTAEVFTQEVEVLTFKSARLAFFIDSPGPK